MKPKRLIFSSDMATSTLGRLKFPEVESENTVLMRKNGSPFHMPVSSLPMTPRRGIEPRSPEYADALPSYASVFGSSPGTVSKRGDGMFMMSESLKEEHHLMEHKPHRSKPEPYTREQCQIQRSTLKEIIVAGSGGGDDGGDDDPDEHGDEGHRHKHSNASGGTRGNPIDHTSRRSGGGSGGDGGDHGSSELDDDKKWRTHLATTPP